MSVRIGHASISETGGVNGAKGDQSKKEVCVRSWYSQQWDFMAIHPSASVREKHAAMCEVVCANDFIGYGQADRNTLHARAKEVNFDYSKIKTPCNCDCSSLQNSLAVASGAAGATYGSNGWTTSVMKTYLKQAGYIIITDSKYLSSENYCVRGAIYVKSSAHTVCGLDNGSKAAETLKAAGITSGGNASGGTQTTKVEYAKSMDKALAGKYTVTASDGLNLRAGAGTNKKIILAMPYGAAVQCYGYYTDVSGTKWLYVTYKGQTGFASSKYLRK